MDLITASHDSTARVWDGNKGACTHVLEGHEGEAVNEVLLACLLACLPVCMPCLPACLDSGIPWVCALPKHHGLHNPLFYINPASHPCMPPPISQSRSALVVLAALLSPTLLPRCPVPSCCRAPEQGDGRCRWAVRGDLLRRPDLPCVEPGHWRVHLGPQGEARRGEKGGVGGWLHAPHACKGGEQLWNVQRGKAPRGLHCMTGT